MSDAERGRILVTGANGFVGRAVCSTLAQAGYVVRALVRAGDLNASASSARMQRVVAGDITRAQDWPELLEGIAAVVHLAARTHVIRRPSDEDLARYREINVEVTRALANAAARAGVRRFVYMSSIKVNGESTSQHPYTERDTPNPRDAYGVSKWEAEQAVAEIGRTSSMETAILRPPLVYGPYVKGNLLTLMRAVDRHIPLPLASIHNERSLIYVGNLADAVLRCIDSPHAAGKTYLVADGDDVSTPGLVRKVASGMGVTPLLFRCPAALLKAMGRVLGKSEEMSRLTGSLQIDTSRIRSELGWQPPHSLDEGLRDMAAWYRAGFAAKGVP